MTVRLALQLVGTFLVSVYSTLPFFWLVVHPWARRSRSAGRKPYVVAIPIWIVLAGLAFWFSWRFRDVRLYDTGAAWIPSVIFILMGLVIYRQASRDFGRNTAIGLSELKGPEGEQPLVVSGIRSRVRHPIYLGHFCEGFGWCLGTGSLALIALLGLGLAMGALMIREEERELEQRFGERYREYRKRVPAFLPRKN